MQMPLHPPRATRWLLGSPAGCSTCRHVRTEGSLPFPNFSPEQAARLGGSVDFPPAGSAQTSDAEAPRVR